MSKKNSFTPVKPLNHKQAELIKAIHQKEMVIITGPAGTGKSYIAAALAAQLYHQQKVKKIILTRPTVPVGKTLGFMPGTLLEKLQPWVAPFTQVLEEFLSKGEVDCMLKNDKLQLVPFETIRGHTFNESFVILDEAQNTTKSEMTAFLTRIGKGSTTIINGDFMQSDLAGKGNGLEMIADTLSNKMNSKLRDTVDWVDFSVSDIVRGEVCRLWIEALS